MASYPLTTAPPARCRDIGVVLVTATAIIIAWTKPEQTGREDFYYTVYYKQLSAPPSSWVTAGSYVNNSERVEYTVDGLQPSTDYVLRVVAHNGVSDQDLMNEESRTCETAVTTASLGGCVV